MSSTRPPIRVLVPFEGDWEVGCLEELAAAGHIELFREGFDLRHFPDCCRLAWFDASRFVDRIAERYRGRVDAVWSCEEQFGCLIAAAIARRLGLPGADPAAVVRAQHKLLMRAELNSRTSGVVPAAVLPFALGDRRLRDTAGIDREVERRGLSWPLFAKPVKGTFSVLARRVESAPEVADHLELPRFDRYVIKRLTRPFEDLARRFVALPCPAGALLLEEPMKGHQVNVDGYAERGELHLIGVVDEWMYGDEVAGARHFAGFTYPSRLDPALHDRVVEAAFDAVRAVGFDHGLFNVEMFVREDGSVRVIEINPRAAGQFSTLYRDVEGLHLERIGIALAAGIDPSSVRRDLPRAEVAGSIVYRRFDGRCGARPTAEAMSWLESRHPDARLWLQPMDRRAVEREYRWLGSHRYAVLNCGAADFEELEALGEECGKRLFGVSGPALYASSPAVRKPVKTSVR